ncbi:GumC family protein [Dyella flagellata]|uniref:Biofilm formation protein PslE n=1 Tax=Dyella flagellata TaxID=1867833 RepID=A0ABQ5XG66_9GAMM|nr:hypothetical protein [Dyella flagellata]GLQ89449.1 biofilm formation protein PslE [Dyella flagellata]
MIEIRSFRDVLRLFFIFRREFIRAVAVTVVVAVLGALLLPTRYASDVRLLVKPGQADNLMQPQLNGDQGYIQPSSQRDPLLDEEKMLTSEPVARRVANAYLQAMASAPAPKGIWKTIKHRIKNATEAVLEDMRVALVKVDILDDAPPTDRMAAKLLKAFQVSHDPGSNVMDVQITWDDPAVAQMIAQAWVDAYYEQRANAAGSRQLYDFYAKQSNELGTQIAGLKKQLLQGLHDLGATSVQQRMDSLSDRLQRLYKQREDAVGELDSLPGALSEARQQLLKLPAEVVSEREVSLNPTQQDLLLKLNGLKAQRLELLRTYREGAPPIREIDGSIRAMQAQIEAIDTNVQRSENLQPNPLATKLRQDIQDSTLRTAELGAHIKAYDEQIAQLQKAREDTMAADSSLAPLALRLTAAEKNFAQYMDYLMRERVIRDLNDNRLSNVALIEPATYSPARIFPKTAMILLAALPAGIAVGLFVILLCYLLDQRIHDGGRVQAQFGVPLWASLPELDAPDALPWRAQLSVLYRIYNLLPHELVAERGITVGLTSAHPGEGVRFVAQHLQKMLLEHGHQVSIGERSAGPGEIVLITAAPLNDGRALLQLRPASVRVLVVEARRTSVPAVDQALIMLRQAFGQIDGVIVNRRRYEVPQQVMAWLARWREG